jgi:hypothetical protein
MRQYAVMIGISDNHDFCFDAVSLEELKAYYKLVQLTIAVPCLHVTTCKIKV